jgi:glycosyltransferase involved in cell wall biosynthesis
MAPTDAPAPVVSATVRTSPATLQFALEMPEERRAAFGQKAMDRVRAHYSWDAVTDAYEALLTKLVKRAG